MKNELNFHQANFEKPLLIVDSPGRVNILGEHTDYNGGTVLPFAIHKKTQLIFSLSKDSSHAYSHFHQEKFELAKEPASNHWGRYIVQALHELQKEGHCVPPFNLSICGDLPIGQGLSSSTALTCGLLAGLNHLNSLGLTKNQIVKLSSKAEHASGTLGGIMDQTAILYGQKGHFLEIDCLTKTVQAHLHELQNSEWLLINSMVNHELSGSEYNDRRKDCDDGLQLIKEKTSTDIGYTDLTAAHLQYFEEEQKRLSLRIKHFIEEQKRVQHALGALAKNEPKKLGKLLTQCHKSLSENYEVSTPEIDFLVASLIQTPNVYGARMIGGGFGGSVLALVNKNQSQTVLRQILPKYFKAFKHEAQGFVCYPCDGLKIRPYEKDSF